MKSSDIVKGIAYDFASGKILCSYTLSDMTKVQETKEAVFKKIPKNYEGKKIIVNIHNISAGTYKSYILKNPNLLMKVGNIKKIPKKITKKKNVKKRLKQSL